MPTHSKPCTLEPFPGPLFGPFKAPLFLTVDSSTRVLLLLQPLKKLSHPSFSACLSLLSPNSPLLPALFFLSTLPTLPTQPFSFSICLPHSFPTSALFPYTISSFSGFPTILHLHSSNQIFSPSGILPHFWFKDIIFSTCFLISWFIQLKKHKETKSNQFLEFCYVFGGRTNMFHHFYPWNISISSILL